MASACKTSEHMYEGWVVMQPLYTAQDHEGWIGPVCQPSTVRFAVFTLLPSGVARHAHRKANLAQQNLLDEHTAIQQLLVQLLLDLHGVRQYLKRHEQTTQRTRSLWLPSPTTDDWPCVGTGSRRDIEESMK